MSELEPKGIITTVSESPKVIKGKNGDAVILVPQPTDDAEDPLVSDSYPDIDFSRFQE